MQRFGEFINEIEAKEYWQYEAVKELVDCAGNETVESLLTFLGLTKVRKYLSDGKQHNLYVQKNVLVLWIIKILPCNK